MPSAHPPDPTHLPTPPTHPQQLLDFAVTGGVPQTLPRLLDALKPHLEAAPLQPLRAAAGR